MNSFDFIKRSNTGLFIGETYLNCSYIDSIEWQDVRNANVLMNILFENKRFLGLIVNGATIELMNILCSGAPRMIKENYELLVSLENIYDIEKVILNPVINYIDDESRLDICISFKCSLGGLI